MKLVTSSFLALALLLLSATAAPAAESRLGLSRDGVTWVSSIEQPLFDPEFRWVPGDREVASFFVRNQSGEPAQMAVDVLGSRVDSLLRTGDVAVAARADGGPWRDVSGTGRQRLLAFEPTSAGETRRVDVRVSFDPASSNQSQVLRWALDLRVLLRQSSDGTAGSGGGASPDGGGLLPNTGAPAFWSLFAGLALAISGLIVALRRRQESESHV